MVKYKSYFDMFNNILDELSIDSNSLNNLLIKTNVSKNTVKMHEFMNSLNIITSNVIDVFKIYVNDIDNFDDLLLEDFSKNIKKCYVQSNVSDFYNTINWKNLCYRIDEIIKNNKDFNIYKIREIDNVKKIILSLFSNQIKVSLPKILKYKPNKSSRSCN